MSDYKHGEMDIEVQEKTFDGFVKAASYTAIFAILVLVFMALVNS